MSTATVVYQSFPTSNHNAENGRKNPLLLFTSLFLHQTTTAIHKPFHCIRCLPVFSYIKPQPILGNEAGTTVVYQSFPTSNHNSAGVRSSAPPVVYQSFPTSNHNPQIKIKITNLLFTSLFLHQTTTSLVGHRICQCCLPVFSYIKPQLPDVANAPRLVVYQSFPTSNHNISDDVIIWGAVVYQSFPTSNHNHRVNTISNGLLFTSLFLHQTTTRLYLLIRSFCCLPVFSYIKPQLVFARLCLIGVVYQSFPTSNHNRDSQQGVEDCVVYQSFPTSNHNYSSSLKISNTVVYQSFPTSNHNIHLFLFLEDVVVYQSFPTSNHN